MHPCPLLAFFGGLLGHLILFQPLLDLGLCWTELKHCLACFKVFGHSRAIFVDFDCIWAILEPFETFLGMF